MSVSTSNSQSGMVSLVVLTMSSAFLLGLVAVATMSQFGPMICVLARAFGLPPLIA
ncbi:MAG: hypothetical protein AB8C46_18435 [Burkholderiaceae bacterium]